MNLQPITSRRCFRTRARVPLSLVMETFFPPAINLGRYAYEEFLNDNASGRPGPSGLNALGRVLHLAQDMTVPHHVLGLLGGKHADYEANVDRWYWRHDLVDFNLVAQHLRERKCLKADCEIGALYLELAEYTRMQGKKAGRFKAGRYAVGRLTDDENKRRAKDLINLAIAANVAILRKTWSDRAEKHSRQAGIFLVKNGKSIPLGEKYK